MRWMKNLFIIRHAEQLKLKEKKLANEDSQISNEKITLTVEGEKQAEKVSELPELNNIEILWSSNYVRAIATAKYIAEKNNIPIYIDERLNERKLRRFRKVTRIGKRQDPNFYRRTIAR